jgi:hypothetical protein
MGGGMGGVKTQFVTTNILSKKVLVPVESILGLPKSLKIRALQVKEYRRERRAERKANTLAFKEEKGRQEKILLNTRASFQGVKIL